MLGMVQGWDTIIGVISVYHGAEHWLGLAEWLITAPAPLSFKQGRDEMKRHGGIKQPSWPRHMCKGVYPYGGIVLPCQGEPWSAVGFASIQECGNPWGPQPQALRSQQSNSWNLRPACWFWPTWKSCRSSPKNAFPRISGLKLSAAQDSTREAMGSFLMLCCDASLQWERAGACQCHQVLHPSRQPSTAPPVIYTEVPPSSADDAYDYTSRTSGTSMQAFVFNY